MTFYKTLRKTIRFLDWMTDKFVYILCLCVFLMGMYGLWDSYLIYQKSSNNDILKYKPGYERDNEIESKPITGNMVAWLTIDDTNIDYPVMQGETNSEYLNLDPFGEYSLSGSLFLDSRNSDDFSDGYSLVYGHHMEYGVMFGDLAKFMDKEYFLNHLSGELIVGEYQCKDPKVYRIRIFAALEANADEINIFSPTEISVKETLDFILKNSINIEENNKPKDGERIIAFSTCKFPDTIDRTIVVGVLEE